ncbi:MAG: thioredoxin family protein [Anaerolineaceae bacterium]
MNKKISLIFLVISILLLFSTSPVFAQANEPVKLNIYFFWGDGCPHCAEEEPFLESLEEKYPSVTIVDYEVWYNEENQKILNEFGKTLGFEPSGVPVTIIGDQVWIGFREEYKAEMENAVQNLLQNPDGFDVGEQVSSNSKRMVTLPIFGEVDLEKQSLVISTAIIGFIDGFNPCSLWVLSVLLALTIHSGSRKKTLIVGLTYLIVTAIVYGLFITGVFTLLSYVGYLRWIQAIVAVIAIVFGIVNLKDYFWYKEGFSFTISEKKKPGLYKNMRSTVVTPRSLLGLIGSSAALAVGVSFIEFSCTAGFPVIWSNLVSANQVSVVSYLLLLGLYMLIYLLDEIVVFGVAVFTMQASHVEEKHGRVLKLISGVIMFILGIVMAINPVWMNDLSTSLLVFLIAIIITILIFVIHKKILPKFGIYIGNESQQKKGKKKQRRQ